MVMQSLDGLSDEERRLGWDRVQPPARPFASAQNLNLERNRQTVSAMLLQITEGLPQLFPEHQDEVLRWFRAEALRFGLLDAEDATVDRP